MRRCRMQRAFALSKIGVQLSIKVERTLALERQVAVAEQREKKERQYTVIHRGTARESSRSLGYD